MAYTELTIKTLYGRSYNECNHPDCAQMIIELDPNTSRTINHGKIAHIRARNAGGERWDKNYPPNELHNTENLILLCAKHHDIIDQPNAANHYTVELLESWKATHYQIKEMGTDREWVYGSSSLSFNLEGKSWILNYWKDKQGNTRFFSPEQYQQAQSASDLRMLFAELGSLLSLLQDCDGNPSDPSRISLNDSYIQLLKEKAERLKQGGFESGLHRLYHNLQKCSEITLAELSLIGSADKQKTSIMLMGEISRARIDEALGALKSGHS